MGIDVAHPIGAVGLFGQIVNYKLLLGISGLSGTGLRLSTIYATFVDYTTYDAALLLRSLSIAAYCRRLYYYVASTYYVLSSNCLRSLLLLSDSIYD